MLPHFLCNVYESPFSIVANTKEDREGLSNLVPEGCPSAGSLFFLFLLIPSSVPSLKPLSSSSRRRFFMYMLLNRWGCCWKYAAIFPFQFSNSGVTDGSKRNSEIRLSSRRLDRRTSGRLGRTATVDEC